jgi:hypothetical protein
LIKYSKLRLRGRKQTNTPSEKNGSQRRQRKLIKKHPLRLILENSRKPRTVHRRLQKPTGQNPEKPFENKMAPKTYGSPCEDSQTKPDEPRLTQFESTQTQFENAPTK